MFVMPQLAALKALSPALKAIAAVLFVAALFGTGYYVGGRVEAASQLERQLKAQDAASKDTEANAQAALEAQKQSAQDQQKTDQFFGDSNDLIEKLYGSWNPGSQPNIVYKPKLFIPPFCQEILNEAKRTATCSCDPVFDADELRLFNLGNSWQDIRAGGVSGAVPGNAPKPD